MRKLAGVERWIFGCWSGHCEDELLAGYETGEIKAQEYETAA